MSVAMALVAAVVAEHVTRAPDPVVAELAAELVAAPLDLDVLAALLVAAVVAERRAEGWCSTSCAPRCNRSGTPARRLAHSVA
jgi:hypothetical protein